MHRNELRQIAKGLKNARPANPHVEPFGPTERWANNIWAFTVRSVADALELTEKPRSNFLAEAGVDHA